MLVFLDELSRRRLSTDVCIVGGGPAGLTLAMELEAQGIDVVLCEGGGLEGTPESQECYEGETVGDEYHYLDVARLRYLGGTSNHWTGVCADLADEDFAAKPAAPETAWPIGPEELRPYITRARDMLDLPPTLDPQPVLDGAFARLDVKKTDRLRFRDMYLEDLIASQKVTTILNANLTDLETEDQRVKEMHFHDYEDRRITVAAKHFVIACGGIENARLLMHFNAEFGTEFGTASGALGAYFTEHPHGNMGEYVLFDGAALNFDSYGSDFSFTTAHIAPTEKFLAEGRVLNMRLKFQQYRHETSKQVVEDLLCTAPKLAERLTKADCAGRVGMILEQAPIKENRIELGTERDRFGIRHPTLYWHWSEQDRQTAREIGLAFARRMAEADIGRMSLSDWVLDSSIEVRSNEHITAFHHIGATRMAASAEDGVVDPDCRVFGSDNLFLAGSSVFPSCGHANPTAPIMGLALRLADHLAALQV